MGFITILIYLILSVVVGTLLVGLSLDIFSVEVITFYLKEIPWNSSLRLIVSLIGVILILISFRYLQTLFRRTRKNKSVTFETGEGKVSITLFAIEDMLKKILEEKAEISHIRPKVFLRKKNIEVLTRGILTAEVNLVELTKEIQGIITTKMNNLLGEDKNVQVNLEIRKVALGGKKGLIEDKEPEIPFRNYE